MPSCCTAAVRPYQPHSYRSYCQARPGFFGLLACLAFWPVVLVVVLLQTNPSFFVLHWACPADKFTGFRNWNGPNRPPAAAAYCIQHNNLLLCRCMPLLPSLFDLQPELIRPLQLIRAVHLQPAYLIATSTLTWQLTVRHRTSLSMTPYSLSLTAPVWRSGRDQGASQPAPTLPGDHASLSFQVLCALLVRARSRAVSSPRTPRPTRPDELDRPRQ